MRLMILSLALAGLVASVGPEAPQSKHPVAIELFTSQGCSSCPPADAFAESLARRADVVVITRPVTFWDRLGWKDTLARQGNTDLQHAYASRGGEGAGVYTPQMMVQGRFAAVGSDRAKITQKIATARSGIKAAIAVRPGFVGVAGTGGPADVKLVGLKSNVEVRIGSGENGGRVIHYSNVVISEQVIGRWRGGTETFSLPGETVPGADKMAFIVQSPNSGPILAAAYR
jgi:hypothetical protein